MSRIILTIILLFSLSLTQITLAKDIAATAGCDRPGDVVPGVAPLCDNIDDILCKDVKKEERRGCSDDDQSIISQNMSTMDVYHFARGCFKSSVTSFTHFFTQFLPELLAAMWKVTKGIAELTVNSFSSKREEAGWWGKMKGIYETSRSIAVDVYEDANQNPGELLSYIWSRMVDVIGPMVASYDCLKPQLKVERICGFVAGWIVPPAMLAKVLIKGSKFIKESYVAGAFVVKSEDKLRLQKALELAEKRPRLSYKQYQDLFSKFKALGYSEEEVLYLYRSNLLQKIKIEDLKLLDSAEGKVQREELLKGFIISNAIITSSKAAQIENIELRTASKVLNKIDVDHQVQMYRGEYDIIKVLPNPSKNNPTWIKMIDALDKNHDVPTNIDPVLLKKAGVAGASIERPGVKPVIALNPKLLSGNPEDLKLVVAHEAVHATGSKKLLAGIAGPDNNLKMQFQSTKNSLHNKLPGQYSNGFSVDEVKAYAKQARILKTRLRKEGPQLSKAEFKKLNVQAIANQKIADNFAQASLDLLNKTENFLLEKKYEPAISYTRRERTDIYDVVVKVSNKSDEPFYFVIPIYDSAAAKTGQLENVKQKLLQTIREAKKAVTYYQNGL